MDDTAPPATSFATAAYGGAGWSPRAATHGDEIGTVWAACGIDSEWTRLRAVVLHRPGAELAASAADADAVQMLDAVEPARAAAEHDALVAAFHAEGVAVHMLAPAPPVRPNQMFCADLMFATPHGVVLARPASTVRAGEECEVARTLAGLGVPIVRTLGGRATFEGADAMWVTPKLVAVGRGLRTNDAAIAELTWVLGAMGVEVRAFDMPFGTMHLMGMLRFADRDLAIAWPRRTPHALVELLRAHGYRVAFLPETDGEAMNRAMNFVTLGPRRILMNDGYELIQRFYEELGIACVRVRATELVKAAGGFGCLTGVLTRDRTT